MGCDGGTIPRRDELVRLKKKPEQKDKDSELQYRWRHCTLTQQPLQEPIVMCGLGRLYSKQNVIEHLLEKEKMPESANHIKSLKDVKNLNLTKNPTFNKGEDNFDVCSAPYICKLIGLEMSGKFRFIGLWECGCVFSERAFKEIKTNVCSLCQVPYSEQDVIILNGSEEDVNRMQVKLDSRNARRKASSKKDKNDKKLAQKELEVTFIKPSSTSITNSIPSTSNSGKSATIVSTTQISSKLSIKTDLISPKPMKLVSSKLALTKSLKRGGTDAKYDDPEYKKSKDAYSVAHDPKASDVYKSLFTSHQDDKDQSRAHWITYNPFYN